MSENMDIEAAAEAPAKRKRAKGAGLPKKYARWDSLKVGKHTRRHPLTSVNSLRKRTQGGESNAYTRN